MKHNFPKGKNIICGQKLSLAQTKEIFKMCIDVDILIYKETLEKPVDESYPYLVFEDDILTQLINKDRNSNRDLIVSFEEFKAFLRGKGKYKEPPKPITLKLNDEYNAEISKSGIKVGCQIFTHESIDKLYALSKKMRK